jgi:hypothetical protein
MFMVNCCAAALAPSLSVRTALHVLLPKALGAGVNVSTPPELSRGTALNNAVSVHVTVKLTVWLVSPGPAVMFVAHVLLLAPVFSATLMLLGPGVNVGASFSATSSNGESRDTARFR